MQTRIKTPAEIDAMRKGGKILAATLQKLQAAAEPGMSSADLSKIARAELDKNGVKPVFLGYQGFPDILCVSINDEVVHGIPSEKRIIKDGDIVSCDFGVLVGGMVTDAAISFIIGSPKSPAEIALLETTKRSLDAGLAVIKDGVPIGTIGAAVEEVLRKGGLGVVKEFVGHGVGEKMHEEPGIPNYGQKGSGPHLRAGMTVAIEPMATIGDAAVYIDSDRWTVKTRDGSRAAHFENTILVTRDGCEILTTV
jgi:methionyl aminopeptidase